MDTGKNHPNQGIVFPTQVVQVQNDAQKQVYEKRAFNIIPIWCFVGRHCSKTQTQRKLLFG